MQEYLSQVKRLQSGFDLFSLLHVSRSGNTHADSLATLATSSAGDLPRIILVEHLDRANKVAKGMAHIHEVIVGPSWMDPMVKFLKDDILPEEKLEAEKIRRKAPRFWLSEDHKLYNRSYSGSYLLYVHPEASNYCLKSYMKGSAGVTQEEDLCHIEPLPRDTGGRGETLLHDSESLAPSFQTMDSSLTARPSENTATS